MGDVPAVPEAGRERLGDHHRAALTLRYVDGLPVPEVAELLGRTVHATEALLVRARSAPLDLAPNSPSRCGAGSWRSWT